MIPVTDATQRLIGTCGYVAAFDLSDYEPQVIHQIQVKGTDDELSDVITAVTSPEALDALCEDTNCPDIAFNQMGNVINVFLKTSVYAYEATVEVEFTYHRNAQNIVTVATDYIDIPQSAKELFKNLCYRVMYEAQNKEVPYDVTNNIRRELSKLGL